VKVFTTVLLPLTTNLFVGRGREADTSRDKSTYNADPIASDNLTRSSRIP
jgi:hypothetical protein